MSILSDAWRTLITIIRSPRTLSSVHSILLIGWLNETFKTIKDHKSIKNTIVTANTLLASIRILLRNWIPISWELNYYKINFVFFDQFHKRRINWFKKTCINFFKLKFFKKSESKILFINIQTFFCYLYN